MQIVREPTGDSTTRLNEIMHEYTPPMRRVCAHMPDAVLRQMIERMATRKLEEERRRQRRVRARSASRAIRRPRRTAAEVPAMRLAS